MMINPYLTIGETFEVNLPFEMKVGLPELFLLFFVWVRFQVRCPIETPLKGAIHVEDDAQDDPT